MLLLNCLSTGCCAWSAVRPDLPGDYIAYGLLIASGAPMLLCLGFALFKCHLSEVIYVIATILVAAGAFYLVYLNYRDGDDAQSAIGIFAVHWAVFIAAFIAFCLQGLVFLFHKMINHYKSKLHIKKI
jgi:phosphatidylserine synthase